MASLYSRYVPPNKKQKTDSAPPPSILAAEHASSPTENATPIISDASASYMRYVPPFKGKIPNQSSSLTQEPAEDERGSTDRRSHLDKYARKTKEIPGGSAETQHDAMDLDVPIAKEKISKKKKTSLAQTEEVEKVADGAGDLEEDKRHASILARREKSLKKAEKLAKKAAKAAIEQIEADDVAEDVEMEEAMELHTLEPLPQPRPAPGLTGKPTFSSLPSWLEHPIKISPTATASFSKLGIADAAIGVLQQKGFTEAFAVQAAVLPLLMSTNKHKGDVLVSAATGSGKTLAYVLPMIEDISQNPDVRLSGLIVMPTRELVKQAEAICEICANAFYNKKKDHGHNVKTGLAMGSQTLQKEQVALMEQELFYQAMPSEDFGEESDNEEMEPQEKDKSLPDSASISWPKIDILICTPGRLVEHLKSTPGFTLEYIRWLVIDEADKLLNQSFQEWLPTIMAHLPKKDVRKVVLSATMTKDVSLLSGLKLNQPKLVVLEGERSKDDITAGDADEDKDGKVKSFALPANLHETAIKVEEEADKPLYLLELLWSHKMLDMDSQDAEDSSDEDSSSDESNIQYLSPKAKENITKLRGVLIFTNSTENAARLSRLLALIDPTLAKKVGTLSSGIPHSERTQNLASFRSGKKSILIATDLMGRGLDLPSLAHVINYDLPTSRESYVHRVGRTARAGKEGNAWTLFTNTEGYWFWNEIARSSQVDRGTKKVDRLNVDEKVFGDDLKARYEESLTVLGQEARGRK